MQNLKPSPAGFPRRNHPLRLLLLLLAGLMVALVAERWRGQWALTSWKSEMAAKGEIFEAQRLWPPATEAHLEFSNRLAQAIGSLRGIPSDYAGQLSGIIVEQPGSYRRGSQEPRPPRFRNDAVTNTWQNLNELIQQNQSSLQSLRELMIHPPPTMGRDIARCLEEDVPIPNLVGVRLGAQAHIKELAAGRGGFGREHQMIFSAAFHRARRAGSEVRIHLNRSRGAGECAGGSLLF